MQQARDLPRNFDSESVSELRTQRSSRMESAATCGAEGDQTRCDGIQSRIASACSSASAQ
jgi:hypothetical protein